MNAHEQLDRFLKLTPRAQVAIVAVIILVLGGIAFGVFSRGRAIEAAIADKKYAAEKAKYEADIARHEHNEAQLAGENSLLKKQNEATAEILDAADKKRAADAAKAFTDLANERAKRYEEIDTDGDYDSQLCGLCADAERSGHKLSESLCGRCKGHP